MICPEIKKMVSRHKELYTFGTPGSAKLWHKLTTHKRLTLHCPEKLDQLQGGVQVPKPFYVAILFLLGQMNANDRPVQKWKVWRAGDMVHWYTSLRESTDIYHYLSDISLQPLQSRAEERPVERQNPRRWLLSRPSCVHEEMGDQCGGPLQWIAVCGHLARPFGYGSKLGTPNKIIVINNI